MVDVNKGDQEEPKYRSRLVVMEFRSENKELEDLFAGAPPLEEFKMLVSEAAAIKEGSMGDRCILLADVSRAFFEANARREVCVLRYRTKTESKAMGPETQRRTGRTRLPGR